MFMIKSNLWLLIEILHFRPVSVKLPFKDDICEVDDEASNGMLSLSMV